MKNRRPAFYVLATSILGVLAGCFNTKQLTPLPDEWGPISVRLIGDCALLAGSYSSVGEQKGLEPRCNNVVRYSKPEDEWWACSTSLNDAFKVGQDGDRTEISQPDPNTLTVSSFTNRKLKATRTYHREKGEFWCEASNLLLSNVSSFFGGDVASMATAGGMLIGRVGTSRHKKAFTKSSDGSLLMAITESNQVIIAPLAFSATFSAWIRWQQMQESIVPLQD